MTNAQLNTSPKSRLAGWPLPLPGGRLLKQHLPGPTGKLGFIELKGRVTGTETVAVTQDEILYSLNKPDDFILARVQLLDDTQHRMRYPRSPFERSGITTDFNGASVDFPFAELLARAQEPA